MPTLFETTPDYNRLLTVLRNEKPDRVPLYEFFSDASVQRQALGDHPMNDPLPQGGNPALDEHIRLQYYLGYDYISPWVQFGFTGLQGINTTDSEGHERYFLDEHNTAIKNREDFYNYPWPDTSAVDYSDLEYCSKHLPDGMKIVANMGSGLMEWGTWLMGLETFCYTVYDDPSLVKDILKRVNDQQVAVCRQTASHPDVMAVALGDDWGFKTQTFLPPDAMREFIFPGLKRIVDAVHSEGKSFIFHSCGNLALVMDDLADYAGIDAKHSFEDVIMPVTKVKEQWGYKMALLGGVDVDVLCRADEDTLRSYVANIVGTCGKTGGLALGSGNSIANYIPPQSLRVMLDEAVKSSRY